jgi:hypothetical protein
MLLMHLVVNALCLDNESAGKIIAARIAMIVITTSNSMRVKPRDVRFFSALNGRHAPEK